MLQAGEPRFIFANGIFFKVERSGAHELFEFESCNARSGWIHCGNAALRILMNDSVQHGLGYQPVPLLTHSERLFRALAFGDIGVHGNAAQTSPWEL